MVGTLPLDKMAMVIEDDTVLSLFPLEDMEIETISETVGARIFTAVED